MKNSKNLHEVLLKVDSFLQKKDDPEKVMFGALVSHEEIADAEKKLGVTLPPSYVEFVTTYGPFQIVDASEKETAFDEMVSKYKLLTPKHIVERTQKLRASYKKYPDVGAFAEEVLFFQEQSYPKDLFVFKIADARNGEMSVHECFNDEEFEWNPDFIDFLTHIHNLAEKIMSCADEDED